MFFRFQVSANLSFKTSVGFPEDHLTRVFGQFFFFPKKSISAIHAENCSFGSFFRPGPLGSSLSFGSFFNSFNLVRLLGGKKTTGFRSWGL